MNSGSNSSSNMPDRDPEKLAAFVHRALRDLPSHRAPAGLEARVFAAIAARAQSQLPWWQQGWQAWPMLPRVLVLSASVAAVFVAGWIMFAGGEVASTVQSGTWVETHAPWLASIGAFAETVSRALMLLTRGVQPYVLPLCAIVGLGYIALIGLGTSLYRSLIPARETSSSFHD